MFVQSAASQGHGPHQLNFHSLFEARRGYAFPCDEAGQVDMDAMSERQRNNYLYARALMGREVAYPVVQTADECLP